MPPHIVIAGHCTIDEIHQHDGRVLPETPGGAAAYATVGAAMYGAHVTLVTLLGDDYPFERFHAGLSEHGSLDATHVRWAAARSIHNIVWYRPGGNRIVDVESWQVMEELTPTADDLARETVGNAHVLVTAGSLVKQLGMVRRVRSYGRPVVVDTECHYFPTPELKRTLRDLVADAGYFLPSIEHLQSLYNSHSRDVATYADRLCDLGCPWIVVKCGADGCALLDCATRRVWNIPAVRDLQIADTTGAGDAFAGGFTAALADGKEPIDAAYWGTVCASFEVETVGAVMPESFNRERAHERYEQVSAEEDSWRDRSI